MRWYGADESPDQAGVDMVRTSSARGRGRGESKVKFRRENAALLNWSRFQEKGFILLCTSQPGKEMKWDPAPKQPAGPGEFLLTSEPRLICYLLLSPSLLDVFSVHLLS